MNPSDQPIPEVDPSTAHNAAGQHGAVILDVRESEELQQGSIANALHIPLGDLPHRLDEVPQGVDVYVLCHVGQRSAMATAFLQELGHKRVWNIRGGIMGWIRSGLPADWPRPN